MIAKVHKKGVKVIPEKSELTSMVTVARPAKSLDTLEELQAILDPGVAASCVGRDSSTLDIILNRDHPTTLGKKPRTSLSKHRH
ncbi:hypothetical protein MTO96_050609 [Rhipicephalus appendiculatus]